MFDLTTKEKFCVMQKIINIFKKEKEFIFTESNYSNFFGDINLSSLENYLNQLSKRGVISFETYAEDGYEAEFYLSISDYEKFMVEFKTIKKQVPKNFNINKIKILALVMMMILVILMLIFVYSLFFSPYSLFKEMLLPLISILITSCMALITSVLKRQQDNDELLNYSTKLKNTVMPVNKSFRHNNQKSSVAEDNTDENDALRVMLVNMAEIKAYYTLSKTQAKDSFRLAVWMCVLGFVLIVVAVVLPFFMSGKYEVSIITAIGGAIVEVIAGTSLFVYKNSLVQLNHYYESLHENERFLSTVNLVRKLSEDKQDEMYIEIIRSSIKRMRNTIENGDN